MTIRLLSHCTLRSRGLPVILSAALFACVPLDAQNVDPLHVWNGAGDPAALETWVNQRLNAAQADVDTLTAINGPHTVANTLRTYDDAINQLTMAGNETYLMFAVGDSAALRDKAQEMTKKISSASTNLSLNQNVYRALKAEPAPTQDPAARHYLERSLLEYRLAGWTKTTTSS